MPPKSRNRAPILGALLALALLACPPGAAAGAPAGDYLYITRPGDTLMGIGQRLLARPGDWVQLQALNGIAEPRRMESGRRLRIPERLLRAQAQVARLAAVSGEVRSEGIALQPGAALPAGTQLDTGAQGFATIELADGSRLQLAPSSRLRLERMARQRGSGTPDQRLRLQQGRVESQVTPLPQGRGRFWISTPSAVAGVRGTRFRMSADAGGSRAEVTEGSVAVRSAAARPAVVAAGFGMAVTPDGRHGAEIALLPAPVLHDVLPLQERPVVRLAVPALAGARAYRFQVGADVGAALGAGAVLGAGGEPPPVAPAARGARWLHVVAETVVQAPVARFADLPDGDYVLRVRGIDGQGVEGLDADRPFRLKARPEPPFAAGPANGAILRAEVVPLRWTQAPEAARYGVQLARDAAFAELVAAQDAVEGNEWAPAQPLPPGEYFWRVRSVRANGAGADQAGADPGPWGDAQRFTLRPMPADPPPPTVDAGSLSFAWPAEPGQRFLFQLSDDASFGRLLVEQHLDEPRVTVPRPAGGTYYMRVQATDADGFVGPFSRTQTLQVPERTPWWLLLFALPLL